MVSVATKLDGGGEDTFKATFQGFRRKLSVATEKFTTRLADELKDMAIDTLPVWQFAWSRIPKPNMTSPIYPWVDLPLLSSTKSQTLAALPLGEPAKKVELKGGQPPQPPPPGGAGGNKGDDNINPHQGVLLVALPQHNRHQITILQPRKGRILKTWVAMQVEARQIPLN